MADLLDDETFKIGYEDEDARIHRVGGHQEIKRQLHVFLANQEYRSAWSALEKLIKMDKPDVSEYYEIAAEILRGAAPSLVAEFLEFAYISTRKLKKLDIFAAWMEALLEQGDYSRVIGEIDLRIHSKEYVESTKILEVLCMAYYRRYKKIPIKKHLAAAISVFTRAYEMIPNNTKYFNILFELLQTAGDKKRVQQLAHHEIEAMLHTPNIRKAKTILPYVDLSAFQPDYRLEILMALHIMDPSLELEKVDAPILKILRDKFRHEQDGSIRGDLMAYQFNVLIDRLERFQFDNWAMAEFVNCINILQNEEKAGRDIGCIYVALHPIFADRRVLKVATPSEKFIKGAGSLWKLKVKKITDFVDRVQAFYESWKAANHTENEEEYEDSDEEEETFEEQEQRKEQDSDEEEQNFEEMEAEEEQESDEEDEYFEIMEEEEQQEHKQEKEKKYELYEESDESDEEEGYSPTTRRHSYWKCKK